MRRMKIRPVRARKWSNDMSGGNLDTLSVDSSSRPSKIGGMAFTLDDIQDVVPNEPIAVEDANKENEEFGGGGGDDDFERIRRERGRRPDLLPVPLGGK